MKKINHGLCIAVVLLFFSEYAYASMSSTSYRIPTAEFSGGGASLSSETYRLDATLGQPSPLMDTANPPTSNSYKLYPGLWYTIITHPAQCDFNSDRKTDILWRNETTGQNYVWYMNGVTKTGGASIVTMPAGPWQIVP